MLKDKIVTIGDDQKYYVGDELIFNNNVYCTASKYNEELDDCSDDFNIFRVEKENDETLLFIPEENKEIIANVASMFIEKNQ